MHTGYYLLRVKQTGRVVSVLSDTSSTRIGLFLALVDNFNRCIIFVYHHTG